MPTVSNVTLVQGDDKVLRITVRDEATGNPIDLTNVDSIRYQIAKTPAAPRVVSKFYGSGGGISVFNALGGVIDVIIRAVDTATVAGEFQHELEIKDAAGLLSTAMTGTVTITKALIPNA